MTSETRVHRAWALANDGRTIHQDGDVVATIIARADAQRIVRAVNSHDDLLAALEATHAQLALLHNYVKACGDAKDWPDLERAFTKAEAAIKRARGED